jgi:tRNA 2-thiouridine synthesizing protein A
MIDKVLDVKGLNCPLPILKTRKALRAMAAGGTIEVLTTDPASTIDFPAFCEQTGNQLLEQSEVKGTFRFVIRRSV